MQSPYKKIVVFDLETGGFNPAFNNITEIALVAVDMETLEIEEEKSIMIKPWLNLSNLDPEPLREAKDLFKTLKQKDQTSGMNVLKYKGQDLTLKSLDTLVEDIYSFYEFMSDSRKDIFELSEIRDLENNEKFSDIIKIFFDKIYNPDALSITHITREMLEKEGVSREDAFLEIKKFIEKYTVGNSKPIIAGHNIGSLPRRIVKGKEKGPDGFDNPFMEVFFKYFNEDFFDMVNELILDTLKMARVKWFELSSHNLGTCCNEVGLTLKEAHRALPDTVANAKLLIKMLKSLRGEGSQKSTYKRRKFDFNF